MPNIKLVYHGLILKDEGATLASYNLRSGSRIMLVGTPGGPMGDRPGEKVSRFAGQGGGASRGGGGGGGSSSGAGDDGVPRNMTKGEMLAEQRRKKEEDKSEQGVTSRIQEVIDNVRGAIEPQLVQFEARARGDDSATAAAATATATSQPPIETSTTSSNPPQPTHQPPQTQTQPPPTPSAPTPQPQTQTQTQTQTQPLDQTHRLLNELLSRSLLSLDAIPTVSEETRAKRKEGVRAVQALVDRLDAAWEGRVRTQKPSTGAGGAGPAAL